MLQFFDHHVICHNLRITICYIKKCDIIILLTDKFRKVNRINKTFFGKSAEYTIFVPAFYCYIQKVCIKAL
ncbi:hypothetical protein F2Z23_04375 [Bacteroides eggerthii]|uniref:Uncharacterized protein n=1 Tax=Bacteroides eggerthii TaxID=28111 RepID=A0A4V1YUP1_9BACE|nr:hypothetical protein F2Z23_04375 [Bacteroides eggerthii]KAA5289826.1 hypothetical protein F2Z10_00795 [Bacteroides eggerthii]RYT77260.1 hypothetical protein EAJ03_04375 [Bacteroides eggerthii]